MADPTVVICPKGQWTKVATNVTQAAIHNTKSGRTLVVPKLLHTYRDTGSAAPTNLDDAVLMSCSIVVSNTVALDVYVYAVNKDGSVRVEV